MIIAGPEYDAILVELIALLPDIERQNELYNCIGEPSCLIPCTKCRQILKHSDLMQHSELHHFLVQSL